MCSTRTDGAGSGAAGMVYVSRVARTSPLLLVCGREAGTEGAVSSTGPVASTAEGHQRCSALSSHITRPRAPPAHRQRLDNQRRPRHGHAHKAVGVGRVVSNSNVGPLWGGQVGVRLRAAPTCGDVHRAATAPVGAVGLAGAVGHGAGAGVCVGWERGWWCQHSVCRGPARRHGTHAMRARSSRFAAAAAGNGAQTATLGSTHRRGSGLRW